MLNENALPDHRRDLSLVFGAIGEVNEKLPSLLAC